jgi:hypothetical protein
LRVQDGDTFALHRLQHYTSPEKKPSVSLVVDICATGLPDATTYTKSTIESVAFAAAAAPALDVSLVAEGPPPTKAYAFLEQKDPEHVWRGAHELFHSNLELIDELAYIKMLEQPATEKAKEAEDWTCRYKGCNGKYTDARGSGAKSKRNYGFCSSECREAADAVRARAPEEPVQGLRHGLLPARAPEGPVQGLRHGLLPARAPEGQVQGLRHGPLPARAPEAPVQGLQAEGNMQ